MSIHYSMAVFNSTSPATGSGLPETLTELMGIQLNHSAHLSYHPPAFLNHHSISLRRIMTIVFRWRRTAVMKMVTPIDQQLFLWINSVLPYPRLARWSDQTTLGAAALPTCTHIQNERLAVTFSPTILIAIKKEHSVKGKKRFHLFPIRKNFQTKGRGVLFNSTHCVPMGIKHWVYAVDSWKPWTLFKAAALNIIPHMYAPGTYLLADALGECFNRWNSRSKSPLAGSARGGFSGMSDAITLS